MKRVYKPTSWAALIGSLILLLLFPILMMSIVIWVFFGWAIGLYLVFTERALWGVLLTALWAASLYGR